MRTPFFLLFFCCLIAYKQYFKPISEGRINAPETLGKPYVVMVSFDGFRHDYAEKYGAENFLKLANEGVSAVSMTPCFPSKTFPNHYTLVTGLYPLRHGLVNNTFYDPQRKERYSSHDRKTVEDGSWYGGTPLWVLAEQQGMLSASFFWVGSEADIQGIHPTHYYKYDGSIPNHLRIDQVVKWLELPPGKRPHLIMLYFSLVDDDGHDYGPDSPELIASVKKADELIKELNYRLSTFSFPINLVVVSDHGMIKVDNKNPMIPQEMADLDGFEIVNSGPFVILHHEDSGRIAETYAAFKSQENNYKAYLRDSIPPHLHFSRDRRVGDILLLAEPPSVFGSSRVPFSGPGTHGFDPYQVPEMGAIFYAKGPAFKQGVTIPVFENIHVYPLVAEVLELEIGEIDGDPNKLKPILAE